MASFVAVSSLPLNPLSLLPPFVALPILTVMSSSLPFPSIISLVLLLFNPHSYLFPSFFPSPLLTSLPSTISLTLSFYIILNNGADQMSLAASQCNQSNRWSSRRIQQTHRSILVRMKDNCVSIVSCRQNTTLCVCVCVCVCVLCVCVLCVCVCVCVCVCQLAASKLHLQSPHVIHAAIFILTRWQMATTRPAGQTRSPPCYHGILWPSYTSWTWLQDIRRKQQGGYMSWSGGILLFRKQ